MFSERLAELRNKKGTTQDEVASFIGVARTTYANYEQGTREPDIQTLCKLADLYNVPLDYLLGRSGSPIMETSLSKDESDFLSMYRELKNKHFK